MKEGKAPRSEAWLGEQKIHRIWNKLDLQVSEIFGEDEACMVSVLFVPFIIEDRSTTSMFFVVKNLRCEMFVDFVLSNFFGRDVF